MDINQSPMQAPFLTSPNVYKKKKISQQKQTKLLEEIPKNISRWYSYFSHNISTFRQDRDFYNGRQWDGWAESKYRSAGKLPYLFNLLKPIGRQIIGEQKNMRPSISLLPKNTETADISNVKLIQGLMKNLAYSSDAHQHYATTLENMISGSWGVLLCEVEYESPFKFDQKITLRALEDPTNTFFDPNAEDKFKTEGDFCGYWEVMNEEDFKTAYPGVKYTVGGALLGEGRQFCDYVDSKSVVIVQYYKREYKNKVLVQLSNHIDFKIEVLADQVEDITAQYMADMQQHGLDPIAIPPLVETNRRNTQLSYLKGYKATNQEVFDSADWHSQSLPMIFGSASRYFRDGKEYTESFIHQAKDAQKTYNYCLSEAINALSRTRREQVWMTPQQADGYEEILQYPDRQQSHMPFNPDARVPGGVPLFRAPEEISEAFFKLAEQAREDVQRTLGIYAANRGELPNQTSGLAIGRTLMQVNLSLVQILQNLYDVQKKVGEIFLELIPKLYDTERVVAITNENGAQSNAVINQIKPGGQIANNVVDIAYNLEVQPVANFAIQQQMINEELYKLAALDPTIPRLVADLIASNIDSSSKAQIVQRLENIVPPEVLAKEKGEVLPPQPPSPKEQMQKLEMNKVAAEIKKILAEAMATASKAHLDHKAHGTNTLLEAAKLEAQQKQNKTDLLKTVIKSNAEIKKQQLSNMGDLISGMNVLKNSQGRTEDKQIH